MTTHERARKLKNLFTRTRSRDWHVPGIAAVTAVLTAAALLSVVPGTVTSWTITGNAAPLVEAGAMFQPVVGFVQFGMVRIYIPLLSILLVAGGELAAGFLGRWGLVLAVVAGTSAGVQPIVLSGCGCGFGTASSTMTLLEQAIGIGLL